MANRRPRGQHSPRYKAMMEKLRARREELRLTQSEVAAQLGRNQAFLSKAERGERRIDPIDLVDLSRIYGKSPSFFLPKD